MHPSASSFVITGIAVVSLAVAAALGVAIARVAGGDRRRALVAIGALAAWIIATGALGASGLLTRWEVRPPPLLLFAVGTNVAAVVLARSRLGERLARGLPLVALVGFHSFRLPLELVMHEAAREGTMPAPMSFSGANFDVVTGITALALAVLLARGAASRALVAAWNVLGVTLLAIVVTVATLATPIVAAFGPENLNTWIAYFPFSWMLGVNVPAALFGHLVLFRRLALERRAVSEAAATPS